MPCLRVCLRVLCPVRERDNVVYWKTKRKIKDDLQALPCFVCACLILFVHTFPRVFSMFLKTNVVPPGRSTDIRSSRRAHARTNTHTRTHVNTIKGGGGEWSFWIFFVSLPLREASTRPNRGVVFWGVKPQTRRP